MFHYCAIHHRFVLFFLLFGCASVSVKKCCARKISKQKACTNSLFLFLSCTHWHNHTHARTLTMLRTTTKLTKWKKIKGVHHPALRKPRKNQLKTHEFHQIYTFIKRQFKIKSNKSQDKYETRKFLFVSLFSRLSRCVCASVIIRPHLEFKMIELVNKKSDTEKNEWRNDWMNEIERKKERRKEGRKERNKKQRKPNKGLTTENFDYMRANEWMNEWRIVCVHVFVVVFLVNDSFGANMHAC